MQTLGSAQGPRRGVGIRHERGGPRCGHQCIVTTASGSQSQRCRPACLCVPGLLPSHSYANLLGAVYVSVDVGALLVLVKEVQAMEVSAAMVLVRKECKEACCSPFCRLLCVCPGAKITTWSTAVTTRRPGGTPALLLHHAGRVACAASRFVNRGSWGVFVQSPDARRQAHLPRFLPENREFLVWGWWFWKRPSSSGLSNCSLMSFISGLGFSQEIRVSSPPIHLM